MQISPVSIFRVIVVGADKMPRAAQNMWVCTSHSLESSFRVNETNNEGLKSLQFIMVEKIL